MANGLSDREAAFRASREGDLISTAKMTVSKSLKKGDIKTAKWYLERKAADEFSTKSAVAFEGGVIELSLEEKEKALKELVEKFDNE